MNFSGFEDSYYEQLQLYINSGNSGTMPAELVDYLSVIELIRSLYDKYKSKKFIINLLKLPPYELSEYKATKFYVESLNFFYADNSIKREAWANIYADRLDKLAQLCIANDDFEGARRCWADATKLRMSDEKQQVIPRELLDRRPIFFTMTPKKVGFPQADRRKLAQFIDNLEDIPVDVRMRLHRDGMTDESEGNILDADLTDIDFIDEK